MNLYEDESEDLQRIEVVEPMRSYISVVPVLSEPRRASGAGT